MRTKLAAGVAAGLMMIVALACGSQAGPAATPSPVPGHASPPATLTATSAATALPTEEPTQPAPTSPAPSALPLRAAAPHFHSGDAVVLDEIHMVSRTEGWGISGPYILATRDGGRTWREVTPPSATSDFIPDQAFGAFLDAHTAWVLFASGNLIPPEAEIWHTTDGGSTWSPAPPLEHQVVGQEVWAQFAALDPQNVWVLVRGVYLGAGTHYDHELFHTTDGGMTWTSLDGQISDDYTGLTFANASFGVRTLETTGAYAPAPPAYDASSDGGADWTDLELPDPPDAPDLFSQYPYCETYQPVLFSAQSIRMLMACFDDYSPPRQFVSYLYASQDSGTTWTEVRLPEGVLASQDTLLSFGQKDFLLLGREMYRSSDGGGTWSFVKAVSWEGQFSFVDAQTGWAVATSAGEVALVGTSDGARTWSALKPVIGP